MVSNPLYVASLNVWRVDSGCLVASRSRAATAAACPVPGGATLTELSGSAPNDT
jgi:hypothetical protein